jgi:AFG3 family protein
MLHEVISLLGGRAAEEVWFGFDNITTGASNDFERATRIISDMVAKYGMDEDLGPVMYRDKDKDNYTMFKPYSEKTGELIDQKIKDYLLECYDESKKILKKHKKDIDRMAEVLKAKEYLTKEEFELLMEDISQADDMLAKYQQEREDEQQQEAKKKSTKAKKKSSTIKQNENA